MASHEFRTPLSTIMSSASLISKYVNEEQNERREKHINRIKTAVNNLTGILNDFLSLSKIEEGKIEVHISPIILEELCLETIDELKGLLKSGQTIEHIQEDTIGSFETDLRILKNILFNLLSNAIKYSGPETTIRCKTFSEAENLCFEIIDEGIGIPEEDQKHLFSRFFRASNVENIQGTGLGLNIVKKYVELLGGNISFTSTHGKGTTFIVKIPIS